MQRVQHAYGDQLWVKAWAWGFLCILLSWGCAGKDETPKPAEPATGIYALMGEIRPNATDAERAIFSKGEDIAKKRFSPEEGLGPLFTVSFCGACHEKPTFGGGGARYRDFFIYGQTTMDGGFISGGQRGGILSAYASKALGHRGTVEEPANTFALRNPIPFFGIGLLAEISESSILQYADPEDEDGDGISGRPNYDRGFVGRFGSKAQTVSIEGFVRGPIFNHLGLTSNPLSDEKRAALPVPSALDPDDDRIDSLSSGLAQRKFHQAAAPSEPLTDDDGIPDPELDEDSLFALVSWVMLLAAPEPDPRNEISDSGAALFQDIGCASCHVPGLVGPRGIVYAYTDLLLHDMGPEMDDGLSMGVATGSEFRTAPLWGVQAVGPFLHDGRADTLQDAIKWHGGEAERSRRAFEALSVREQTEVIYFLESLGGRREFTPGLIPQNTPIPDVGALGGPTYPLTEQEEALFMAGRDFFDRDLFLEDGLGPRFNGDSCRACHFDPIPGGAGPIGVNAIRQGFVDENGAYRAPEGGSALEKLAVTGHRRPEVADGMYLEPRQTPTLFGLGLLDRIPPEAIIANADPTDSNGDGIRGIAHVFEDGRLGRFGWKAQVPSLTEFARDASSEELGLTVPQLIVLDADGRELSQEFTFGRFVDGDAYPDPEVSDETLAQLVAYLSYLAPPAPKEEVPSGRRAFEFLGCDGCHIPQLVGLEGTIPAYTDLLLHETSPPDDPGVPQGQASAFHYRTPPLWGLGDTAPYLHDGSAATIEAAILAHDGEARTSRDAFEALSAEERAPLLRFLETR